VTKAYKIILTLISIVIIPLLLILYNYFIQIEYGQVISYDIQYWNYIDPIIRQFSHTSEMHLKNNVMIALLYSMLICLIVKNRYYFILVVTTLLTGGVAIFYNLNGIGFSIVTHGMSGFITIVIFIPILTNIYTLLYNRTQTPFTSVDIILYTISIILIFLGFMFSNINIIGDLIITFTSETTHDMYYASIFLDDMNSVNYSDITSKGHVIGFLTGLTLGLFLLIYNKNKLYRDHIFIKNYSLSK